MYYAVRGILLAWFVFPRINTKLLNYFFTAPIYSAEGVTEWIQNHVIHVLLDLKHALSSRIRPVEFKRLAEMINDKENTFSSGDERHTFRVFLSFVTSLYLQTLYFNSE